jgi:hypothetical protein
MDFASWTSFAMGKIRESLRKDSHWSAKLGDKRSTSSVHLAVLVEPYLSYVLDGTKTVESRFSTRRCAPFGRVESGDIVLLKSASGPVMGLMEVSRMWSFDLRSKPIGDIRAKFGAELRADDDFWEAREAAEYATLLRVHAVRAVPPLACPKKDRRGWVVLSSTRDQLKLPLTARA